MRLADLETTFRLVDDREPGAIAAVLAELQRSGLIGEGDLGSQDAANAIIALNGTSRLEAVARTVDEFRCLPAIVASGIESERFAVVDVRDFGEALECLVETAPRVDGMLREFVGHALAGNLNGVVDPFVARYEPAVSLVLQIHSGTYRAAVIRVEARWTRRAPMGRRESTRAILHEVVFKQGPWAQCEASAYDRRSSFEMGIRTFTTLHAALFDGGVSNRVVPFPLPGRASR